MRISGKGKRGRVFVRFAKCTSQGNENEDVEEPEGREKDKSWRSSRGDNTESRIVVLPFYHLTEARTTTTSLVVISFLSTLVRSFAGRVYLK